MKVIPAKPAGDIDTFADEIQTWLSFCHHRFGREGSGIHSADHHFGSSIAFGAGGSKLPFGEALGQTVQLRGGEIGDTLW